MHYIEEENRLQYTMGFSLDEIISKYNAVRIIDAIVEEIYKSNKSRFDIKGQSEIGRKAYKPTTLLKLYLYGYLNSISSSRKLEGETYRNIEMMWLLGNLKPKIRLKKRNPIYVLEYSSDFVAILVSFIRSKFATVSVIRVYISFDSSKRLLNASLVSTG